MRARFFENAIDQDRRRIAELAEQMAQLEATMAEMASIQTHDKEGVDKMMTSVTRLEGKQEEQEENAKNLKDEFDASFNRASSSPDRKDKTVMITNLKGVDRLKSYLGDVSQ